MSLKIDRDLVLRNTLLNILGGVAPLAISVLTLPKVLAAIGAERYGMLSLALGAVGYFGVLDMGLGTAATKFAAEALGRGEEGELPSIVWTTVLCQLVSGLLGSLLLAALAPGFAGGWLKVPASMRDEVLLSLHVLCLVVPLMFIAPTLMGVAEAGQRFDLVNAVAVPSSAAMSLAMYVGACAGFHLPGIVALVVLVRALMTLGLLLICLHLFPVLLTKLDVTVASLKRLLRYGAWLSVGGGLVVPILMYAERFFLGRYLSLSDVAYYTVPYSILQRLWTLPISLVRTLFPAFSALGATDRDMLEDLYLRSLKYLALVSGPIILFLSTFAWDIFAFWLGPGVAAHSAPALRILLYGGLFVMAAYVSGALLDGLGRPDLATKQNAAYVPVHVIAVWLLVRHAGVPGAALGYTLRVAAQALVLTALGLKVAGISYAALVKHRIWGLMGALACLCVLMAAAPLAGTLAGRGAAFAGGTGLFFWLGWKLMLDVGDRSFIKERLKPRLRPASAG